MNKYLIAGGIGSFLVALLHVVIIFGGADYYRLFGAGEEMAVMAEQGSLIPPLSTAFITIVFIVWGLYAFSGAGKFRKLPLLKIGLIVIAAIYIFRGLMLPVNMIYPVEVENNLLIWSSIVSFLFGMFYAIGTWQVWKRI